MARSCCPGNLANQAGLQAEAEQQTSNTFDDTAHDLAGMRISEDVTVCICSYTLMSVALLHAMAHTLPQHTNKLLNPIILITYC